MKFTKMHGIGNDYVYVNCFEEEVKDPPRLARKVSDRHFGIGGDGLILITPSKKADVGMRIFNADGSEAQMCGNGIRCVAKYAYEHGLVPKKGRMSIETRAGVKTVSLKVQGSRVQKVRVNMGRPKLLRRSIPMLGWQGHSRNTRVIGEPLSVVGARHAVPLLITCVSMGNPHCVIYVEGARDFPVSHYGPLIENHKAFPERVNVHFVEVMGRGEVRMRTWERGSGETLACGTGASAVCVAGVLNKKTSRRLLSHLPGGDLELEWAKSGDVYMTGPAEEVFCGEY
ncbi:MAG: diaminopimelate epimerase [Planctomycetes bacterium RIFCSPHIGHO2_02_FULL_52_58]|nr:MAG: diaminopimelate epimerase [Planctomycetes bacterium RIFCSPHIGHO2_02_FULL_52_58]